MQLALWRCAGSVCFRHGCLLFRNIWALGCHFCIQSCVVSPFGWQIVFMEDRCNGTFRNARFAVNAFFRMNEKNRFTFVEAFDWTYNNAVCVFAVEARLSNDMSHGTPFHARSSGDPFIKIEVIEDTLSK